MFGLPSLPIDIQNPHIPFTRGTRVANGHIFSIQGYVPPFANRFSFNLLNGGANGDCALHIDHRFDESCIVRNTLRNGVWENEDRHGDIPLSKGSHFSMQVLVEANRFMIAYNGQHFCEFYHRLPFYATDTCKITGDVAISNYQENMVQPQFPMNAPPAYPTVVDYKPTFAQPQERVYNIPQGLWNGRQIFMRGTPLGGTFTLNLIPHSNASDVGFHLSVRVDSNEVVFNTLRNGNWQEEIRPRNLRFRAGSPFTLMITPYPSEYEVRLDNAFVCMFPVRHIDPSNLHVLKISGPKNVQISELNF